ncbi:Nucleolar protein 5A, partial [Caligus rogercresseyi]
TAADALNNINAVSEGIATEDAQLFVKTHLPKRRVVLGVLDSKLGGALAEALGIRSHTSGLSL